MEQVDHQLVVVDRQEDYPSIKSIKSIKSEISTLDDIDSIDSLMLDNISNLDQFSDVWSVKSDPGNNSINRFIQNVNLSDLQFKVGPVKSNNSLNLFIQNANLQRGSFESMF